MAIVRGRVRFKICCRANIAENDGAAAVVVSWRGFVFCFVELELELDLVVIKGANRCKKGPGQLSEVRKSGGESEGVTGGQV